MKNILLSILLLAGLTAYAVTNAPSFNFSQGYGGGGGSATNAITSLVATNATTPSVSANGQIGYVPVLFDPFGSSLVATQGLGGAAFQPTNTFDLAGAGTTAANQVTNGLRIAASNLLTGANGGQVPLGGLFSSRVPADTNSGAYLLVANTNTGLRDATTDARALTNLQASAVVGTVSTATSVANLGNWLSIIGIITTNANSVFINMIAAPENYNGTFTGPVYGNATTAQTANSALYKPVELLGGQFYLPVFTEDFSPTNSANITTGGTIPFTDGSTNVWTLIVDNGGFAVVTNNELMMSNTYDTFRSELVGEKLPVLGTNAAGWAIKAHVSLNSYAYNGMGIMEVGFTTTPSTPGSATAYPVASTVFNGNPHTVGIEFGAGNLKYFFNNSVKNHDGFDLLCVLTTNGFVSYIQGGVGDNFNGYEGSASWFEVGYYTNATWANSMICPVVCYSGGFVGGMGYVSHIEIYSNWNATGTSGVLLHSMPFENYYVNAPYICQDTNGAFYATFDQGSGDVSLDRVVYAAYRNGSGQWQYPVSVVAGTNDGATAYNAGAVWTNLTGGVVLTYNKSLNKFTNSSAIYYRTSFWNGSSLVLGPETLLNVTNLPNNTYYVSYSPAIPAPDGTLIMPVEWMSTNIAFTSYQYTNSILKSWNNGVSWSMVPSSAISTNTAYWCEGALGVQVDGKVAQYFRLNGGGGNGFVGVSYSSNSGLTWTAPVDTTIPECDRVCISPMPGGNLLLALSGDVFNVADHPVAYVVGNNSTVIQKITLFSFNDSVPWYTHKYTWVGWFNNKICYMVTPQVEDGIWYGEKSLDGAIENQWSANRQRDQKLNAALHENIPLLTNMTAAQVIAAGGLTNAVTILNSTNGYYTWVTNAGGQMTGTWVPTNTPAAALTGVLPIGLLTSSGTNLPGGVLVTDGAGNRIYTNNLNGVSINGASQTNPVVYQFAQTNIMFIGTNALGVPFTNFWVQGTGTSLYTVWQLDNVGYTSLYTVGTNGQYTFNQQVNSGTVSAGSVSLSPIFRGASSASAFTLGASTTPNIFVLATNLNSGALVNNFTNGITSFSTNSITVGSTGLTNTLGKTIVVNFTVGTGCSLFNNQGIAEFSSVAVGAGTQWRVQANGWITGTAITATADAW